MATKTFIQNKIDTNLADSSNINASEHREVEETLLNELYADTLKLTGSNGSGINYYILLRKNGNSVNISGSIINTTGSILPAQTIISFANPEYYPLDGESYVGNANGASNPNLNYQLLISSTGVYANAFVVLSNLGAYANAFFNFNYTTNP